MMHAILYLCISTHHNSTSCITVEIKTKKAGFSWRVSHLTCGCSALSFIFLGFSPPPLQVQCEPCGRVPVSCDWLARWLPSGYTYPRRTPLAWGRCVVQSWRRGMRTCRIFWAPIQEGQNWRGPPHAPRSVAWRVKWLSHLRWVYLHQLYFSFLYLFQCFVKNIQTLSIYKMHL